jgi:oligopeptide/dipeptide ABC transporter ATP-binding protein
LYAGRIVERAPADALFDTPLHPYTLGLIATLPDPSRRTAMLPVIPGGVPDLDRAVTGCRFADRCARADDGCRRNEPQLEQVAPAHFVACFKVRQ